MLAVFLFSTASAGMKPMFQVPTREDWRLKRDFVVGEDVLVQSTITEEPEEPTIEEEIPLEPEEEAVEIEISDPFEPVNRAIFTFNDHLYRFVFRPVVKVYKLIVPSDFRLIIKNFFTNIAMPVRFVNSLLQGKIEGAGRELLRFIINSTVGVLGLVDVASDWGIKPQEEDFGQTLGVYGIGEGPYIVLPVLGPTTLRDGIGLGVDMFLEPLNYLPKNDTYLGIKAEEYTNKGSYYLDVYFDLKESSLDPYAAMRNAYIQRRRQEVKE
ncbi:MAG: VacJ family lipoprotein [Nitrospirae bacterium]|nr:MAG: VacJ family lipoprotein [Nitrospirota bacterium]